MSEFARHLLRFDTTPIYFENDTRVRGSHENTIRPYCHLDEQDLFRIARQKKPNPPQGLAVRTFRQVAQWAQRIVRRHPYSSLSLLSQEFFATFVQRHCHSDEVASLEMAVGKTPKSCHSDEVAAVKTPLRKKPEPHKDLDIIFQQLARTEKSLGGALPYIHPSVRACFIEGKREDHLEFLMFLSQADEKDVISWGKSFPTKQKTDNMLNLFVKIETCFGHMKPNLLRIILDLQQVQTWLTNQGNCSSLRLLLTSAVSRYQTLLFRSEDSSYEDLYNLSLCWKTLIAIIPPERRCEILRAVRDTENREVQLLPELLCRAFAPRGHRIFPAAMLKWQTFPEYIHWAASSDAKSFMADLQSVAAGACC